MSVKSFEFLDMLKYALPTINEIDVLETARNPALLKFVNGRGWGSYGPVWKKTERVWKGPLPDSEVETWWKTNWLVDCMLAIRDYYQGEGRWYPLPQEYRLIGGLRFRSSVRGVLWTAKYGSEVHLINPRKSQRIEANQLGFLARAAYEEYVIDDPASPKVAVLDLSSKRGYGTRDIVMHRDIGEMISADHFSDIMTKFYQALQVAGMAVDLPKEGFLPEHFRIKREDLFS